MVSPKFIYSLYESRLQKGLPKTEVVEAESEWWEVFSNSETYKSM